MNEATDYQARLRYYRKHRSVHSEASWWIDQQLEEMEQEKQKNRSAKRSSLRHWLKYLLLSIIQQNGHDVKGVERNV